MAGILIDATRGRKAKTFVVLEGNRIALLVKDMGSHLQLPRAARVEIYRATRLMMLEALPPKKRQELALCKEAGELRAASGIPSRHCNRE